MAKIVPEPMRRLKENILRAFVGKEDTVDLILTALVSGGHVLIEDMPGLGKTTLVMSLARSLGCTFGRIQFTPDLTPSDVTGYTMVNIATGEREVREGGIMREIVLADEINRTGPKTQSSLLEAMQERQVTIDGESYPLPSPFMVLATQNPVELAGTFPLPEAQLDRFLMRISLGYPELREEMEILKRGVKGIAPENLSVVVSREELGDVFSGFEAVRCKDPVLEYAVRIAEETRRSEAVALGVSPRGTLALVNAARGYAYLMGRDYVLPDDIQRLARPVLLHRIQMKSQAIFKNQSAESLLLEILKYLKVPAVG